MKNTNQRTVNILNKALELGFEFSNNDSIEDVLHDAEDYVVENAETFLEEECEVKWTCHEQRVDWSDGEGYNYWSQGEIIDFTDHHSDDPETKVFHTTLVDTNANVVKLYYLVGETDYNAPEGYYYSKKEGKHVEYIETKESDEVE